MKKNINLILFDLDDTLIDTRAVHLFAHDKAINLAHSYLPKFSTERITSVLEEALSESFKLNAVEITKMWHHVIMCFENKFGPGNFWPEIEAAFLETYKTVPKLHKDAKEVLDAVFPKYPLGVVTHARKDWTDLKIDGNNLRPYFKYIHLISEKRYKDAAGWQLAIKKFNADPQKTLVVGDNISGDIIASREAGIKHQVWIDRGAGWKIYRTGKLPKGVITINSLHELLTII